MEDRLPACVARGRPSELSELFPECLFAKRPAELSAGYRETHEKQAKREEELAKKEADAARHPGREWRAGRAQGPGSAPPRRMVRSARLTSSSRQLAGRQPPGSSR